MSKHWKKIQRTLENLRLAVGALQGSRLRTVLTMLIITVGITALMGMLTVINAVVYSLENELGAQQGSVFEISSWSQNMQINGRNIQRGEDYRRITYREAERFSREFAPFGPAGISTWVASVTASRGSKQTHPSMTVRGVNYAYLESERIEVERGRLFTQREATGEDAIALIGSGIASKLFDRHENPIGARILLGSASYRVVGVLANKVSSFGSSSGNRIYVPIRSGLADFSVTSPYFYISVNLAPGISLQQAEEKAILIMRRVRHLSPLHPNNFNITKNDEVLKIVLGSVSSLGVGAVLIGLITLLGSAVALMNIMLASVTERTREIGIRKAIGAYASTIQQQFLIEAILITLLGGTLGVILGVVVGTVVAQLMNMAFTVPWGWSMASLLLSMGVGVLAGYLPAKRAARLDPIIALRYE